MKDNSPQYLVFSDLHFREGAEQSTLAVCHWIADMVREHEPDYVVFGGDLNHTHGFVSIPTLHAMVDGIDEIARAARGSGSGFLAIAGNHDQATASGIDALRFMRLLPDVTVASTTPVFVKGPGALLCPYPPKADSQMEDYIRELYEEASHANIVFSHWDVRGASFGLVSGRSDPHGIDIDTIPVPVVNGHYHQPQRVGKRGIITGSPCYMTWSDSVNPVAPRGVLLIHNKNGKYVPSRVECPIGEVRATVYWSKDGKRLAGCELDGADPIDMLVGTYGTRLNLRVSVEDVESMPAFESWVAGFDVSNIAALRTVTQGPIVDENTYIPLPDRAPVDIVASYVAEVEQDPARQTKLRQFAEECLAEAQ